MQMIVILLAYAIALAACAASDPLPAPVPVSEHHATATDELAQQQGQLLMHYDAALARAEVLLRKAAIVIAAANKPAAATEVKADDASLAAKARAGAVELEQNNSAH